MEFEIQLSNPQEEALQRFAYRVINAHGETAIDGLSPVEGDLVVKIEGNFIDTGEQVISLGNGKYRVRFRIQLPKHEFNGEGEWKLIVGALSKAQEFNGPLSPLKEGSSDGYTVMVRAHAPVTVFILDCGGELGTVEN